MAGNRTTEIAKMTAVQIPNVVVIAATCPAKIAMTTHSRPESLGIVDATLMEAILDAF